MAIVYRHVRLDTGEVFYVGIGKTLERAYSKAGRNKYWYRIVDKTEYRVDILFEDISREQACKKEIEFIKLYGRRDLGLGTLVNLTDGGEGGKAGSGRIHIHKDSTKKMVTNEELSEYLESGWKLGRGDISISEEGRKKMGKLGDNNPSKRPEVREKLRRPKPEGFGERVGNLKRGKKLTNTINMRLNSAMAKEVEIDGVVYISMTEAERVIGKSRFLIKKQNKVVYKLKIK